MCPVNVSAAGTDPTGDPMTMPTGPTGPTMNTTVTLDTSATDTEGDSESNTTEPPAMCNSATGTYDEQCVLIDPSRPFCVDNSCASCAAEGAGSCPSEASACAASGECVACTAEDTSGCSPDQPVCNAANECERCTAHSQCPGDAGCHLFEGTCLPENAVFYVSESTPGCNNAVGTADTPTCSIAAALMLANDSPERTIRVASGVYAENTIGIGSGAVTAVIGDGGPQVGTGASGFPTWDLRSTTYLDGFNISGSVGDAENSGVDARADLWVENCTLSSNTGFGIAMQRVASDQLVVRRSLFFLNGQGGIRWRGTSVDLENVIIANNGGQFSNASGVLTQAGTVLNVQYSTIVGNRSTDGAANGIECEDGGGEIRNSIVMSSGGGTETILCNANIQMSHSVTDSMADAEQGMNNLVVGNTDDLLFVDPLANDFRIGANSVAADVAAWVDGDPTEDWNGSPRPVGTNAGEDYAGADVPD